MILVTGATGTVGRELVAQLVARKQAVRALTRNPEKANLGAGVEVVKGDLTQPSTLTGALRGVEKVFSLAAGPQIGALERDLASAARQAGVKHIVKLSTLGTEAERPNTISQWHLAGEKAIRESGVAWTLVRPGGFMSNALQWVPSIKAQGKVFAAYGDGKMTMIHPRDIAAVAAVALTTPGHEGKAYPLTGGEALAFAEQVRILSEAVDRPIQYVAISEEQARANMEKAGLPPPLIDGLLQLAAYVRSGNAGGVLPTVEKVTGSKPLAFQQWAKENAAAFKG